MSNYWQQRFGLAFSGILKLFLPASCVACQQAGSPFCKSCYQQLVWIEPPVCEICGQMVTVEMQRCRDCVQRDGCFCRIRSVVAFDDPIRSAIHALKYGNQPSVAHELATIMVRGWSVWGEDVDLVAPVPLHAERQRVRGYNQSAEIARHFAAALALPINTNVIFRPIHTRPQVGLKRQARLENVQNAFKSAENEAAGQRILLIDDVCTTGATLNAAADALYTAGAVSVMAYTLARAQTYREHWYPPLGTTKLAKKHHNKTKT